MHEKEGDEKAIKCLLITTRELEVQHNDFLCEFTKFDFKQLSFTLRRVWVDDT